MRISDWSSDVCSSDLDNAQQILRSGGLQPCNQILLEFSERRHDPLIAMARHCIQYMTHKPRRRLGLWRQTIAEAFGKQARWNLGHGHRFSGTGAPILWIAAPASGFLHKHHFLYGFPALQFSPPLHDGFWDILGN